VDEGLNARLGFKPSKKDMLEAYRQARLDVLTFSVIRGAWKTSGIWLGNCEQPLASKYVMLETTGVARIRPKAPVVIRPKTPDFMMAQTLIPIYTPSGGQALRKSSRKLSEKDSTFGLPSQRLFARKASKALDLQASKIADLEAQVEYLVTILGQSNKRVRAKVTIPPGQRFVRMADVRKVKRKLRGRDLSLKTCLPF
jgi:hypothetical protein